MDLRAKPEVEPVKAVISHMSRFRVYQTDKEGRRTQTEKLTFFGNFIGSDYMGQELNQAFFKGWYKSPKTKFIPDNPNDPNAHDKYGNRLGKVRQNGEFEYVFTIDCSSDAKARKALIDKIIETHKGSFKENILYTYKDRGPTTQGPLGSTEHSNSYSYDQFVKCDLNELHRLMHQRYGPDGKQPWFNSETGKWQDELGNIINR
jgi:hypothetical protein